jgi:hypothetical protein
MSGSIATAIGSIRREKRGLWSRATSKAGVLVDPEITQPYSHEVIAFVERKLGRDLGARAGFVYKSHDNLWQRYRPFRPPPAYTVPFEVTDPGQDGVASTADDRVLHFLGLPRARLTDFPPTQVIQNVPAVGRYRTLEFAVTRRHSRHWSLVAAFDYTWHREHATGYFGNAVSPSLFPNSPNDTSLLEFGRWLLKVYGRWDGPWGISVTPVLRHQSPLPYGRTLLVQAPASSPAFFQGIVLVEPLGTREQDAITLIDLRAEKEIEISRTRLRLFADVFNLGNDSGAQTITYATGPRFGLPSVIVPPRVARLGLRLQW